MQTEIEKDKNLSEIVTRLKDHFKPVKIYLFGSRAKGTAKSDSDYDIFVVVHDSDKKPIQRMQEANRAIWGSGVAADIFVYTEEEFNDWKDEFSSIPYLATTEGVELDIV